MCSLTIECVLLLPDECRSRRKSLNRSDSYSPSRKSSVVEEMRTATSEHVAMTKQLSAEQSCTLELAFWHLQRAEWDYESASANCAVLLRPSDGVVAAYDERESAGVYVCACACALRLLTLWARAGPGPRSGP